MMGKASERAQEKENVGPDRIQEVAADHEAGSAFACLAVHCSNSARVLLQEAVHMFAEAVYQHQWRHLRPSKAHHAWSSLRQHPKIVPSEWDLGQMCRRARRASAAAALEAVYGQLENDTTPDDHQMENLQPSQIWRACKQSGLPCTGCTHNSQRPGAFA